jgi:hypothetical protein
MAHAEPKPIFDVFEGHDGEGQSIRSDALYPALSGEWEVLVTRNEDHPSK